MGVPGRVAEQTRQTVKTGRLVAEHRGGERSVRMGLRRLITVLSVLLRHGLGAVVDRLSRRLRTSLFGRVLPGPERLRRTFEELGGTYIKLGQMLALQPDIISPEYCNALFDLLDRVPPFPASEVEGVFLEELGAKPSELFDAFDFVPIASASIGQVHVAVRQGRKLAVKVQRPSVNRDFAADIGLMNAALWLITKLRLRALAWMVEPMSEFAAWTREELDYRYEARYLRQLRQNARNNPNECFPELLEEYTTPRLLVMDFLDGCTVLNYLRALERGDRAVIERLEVDGFDSHLVASRIVDNFLGDVFLHGVFHADLHPANLMILPENRVGYIDFGITGTISSYSRHNLVALTLAYTRGDLEAMCNSFFRVSALATPSSAARFREALKIQSRSWYESGGARPRLRKNFTRVMLDMSRLSLECGVQPARDVVKYIRSSVVIDGLITRFAPTFNLGAHLESVCAGHLKWHLRRSAFSFDRLLGSAIQMGRLFWDGGPRVVEALARLEAGRGGDCSRGAAPPGDGGLRRDRAIYCAVFLFVVSSGAWLSPQPFRLGVNLATSETLLALAALQLLIHNLRMLPKENQRA